MALVEKSETENPQSAQSKHLLLGTVSFTVCFAAWGLISAFAPQFRQQFHLSATQTAFLVAVPVLLGALARLPIGMLADRFGGRSVFTVLMFFVAVPVASVPAATSYRNLLIIGFLLGMAGSSFAVGVGYVSRWFSMESQGSALGVYGLEILANRRRCSSAPSWLRHTDFARCIGACPSSCWFGQVCLSSLLEMLRRRHGPRDFQRCSACSRANLWRGRWRHSIF